MYQHVHYYYNAFLDMQVSLSNDSPIARVLPASEMRRHSYVKYDTEIHFGCLIQIFGGCIREASAKHANLMTIPDHDRTCPCHSERS